MATSIEGAKLGRYHGNRYIMKQTSDDFYTSLMLMSTCTILGVWMDAVYHAGAYGM